MIQPENFMALSMDLSKATWPVKGDWTEYFITFSTCFIGKPTALSTCFVCKAIQPFHCVFLGNVSWPFQHLPFGNLHGPFNIFHWRTFMPLSTGYPGEMLYPMSFIGKGM
jgi:hypothetical protein